MTAQPRRAVCPGSFDPIHSGHVAVIERAARLFDEVIVAVADNPSKRYRFARDQRLELTRRAVGHVPRARVELLGRGLIAERLRDLGAVALVKGLRTGADFDYELPMATMNRSLTGAETVFLAGDPQLAHVSSSLLKEVHGLGGDVSAWVPAEVLEALDATRPGS